MKGKILEALQDPEVTAALQAIIIPLLTAIVKQAVAAAVEAKDEEISNLRRELMTSEPTSTSWNSIPAKTVSASRASQSLPGKSRRRNSYGTWAK